jgi:hypothetical protein
MSKFYIEQKERPDRKGGCGGIDHLIDVYMPGLAWRISIDHEGETYTTVMGFGSKRDAEMARDALERSGAVDFHSLVAIPAEQRQQIMLEAMQW